jgi:hypothetical protein
MLNVLSIEKVLQHFTVYLILFFDKAKDYILFYKNRYYPGVIPHTVSECPSNHISNIWSATIAYHF